MKNALLLFLLFGCVFSLYEYQAGVFDWSIRNIGEIDSVSFGEQNFYFTIKDDQNSIGSASYHNGKIDFLITLPGKILNRKFNRRSDVVFFYNDFQKMLGVFHLKIGSVIKTEFLDIESPIVDFVAIENLETLVFCSKKQLLLKISEKELILYQTKEEEELHRVIIDETKNCLCLVLSNKNNVFVKKYNLEKKTLLKEINIFILKNDFNEKKLIVNDGVIIYENDEEIIRTFSIEKEEISTIQTTKDFLKNTFLLENTLIKLFEDEKTVHLKEISLAGNKIIDKLEYVKERNTVYKYKSIDLTIANIKRAFIIANINHNQMNIEIFNVEKGKKAGETLVKILKDEAAELKDLWMSENGWILIQTQDLQTTLFSLKEDRALWSREDSLAYITNNHFVNFEDINSKKVNDYFESLENEGTHNSKLIIKNFLQRIKTEIDDFTLILKGFYETGVNQIRDLTESQSLKHAINILNKFGDNTAHEILYDLKKIILLVTKYHTLFALDSKTGDILWKKNLKKFIDDMENYEVLEIFSLESKQEDTISIKVILVAFSKINQKLIFIHFSPANGDILDQEFQTMENVHKIVKIPAVKHIHNDVLLILDDNLTMRFYPSAFANNYKEKEKKISLYTIDEVNKAISGYKFFNNKFEKIWNISMNNQEEVLKFKTLSSDDENALFHTLSGEQIGIHEDKKIIFKHINYNNFAVLTKLKITNELIESNTLNLYIVSGVSGRILFNQYISDVNFDYPINLLVDENGVFVTYYNEKNLIYEIWVIEAFSNRMENSFTNMLEKYYFRTHHSNLEEFNYNLNELDVVFLQAKYAFPLGIKECSTFKSKREVTRKNLLIITPSNQIYSLDRTLLSTRRSVRTNLQSLDLSNSFESIELPPYQYMLPINDFNYVTYNLKFSDLRQIYTSPTNFESTSLLLAYGRDIFSSKIAPDTAYDKINDDFNYFYLMGTVITVVVVTMFVKNMAKKTRIYQNFNR